jgi:hypothetical protein
MGEINSRAEQKSDSKAVQDQYAKDYRTSVHRWSYDRLGQTIQGRAGKIGVPIEVGQQPAQGTQLEKARDLAIATYHFRQASLTK